MDAGPDPGILCGTTTPGGSKRYCTPMKQDCCAQGSGAQTFFRCVTAGSGTCQNGGGVAIPCDSTSQCPSGNLCCGTLDPQSNAYVAVQCQATCDSSQNQYVFCTQGAQPDVCAQIPSNGGPPYACGPSDVLPGYYRCSN
jgi:hypothetical protein